MENEEKKQALDPEIVPPGMENIGPFKKSKRNPKIAIRDAAIANMVAAGISPSKAAQMLGLDPSTGYRALQRIQGEDKGISALVSTERDSRLLSLLDDFMERGKKIKKIRGSDAIGAAKLYADRRYPILRQDAPKPPVIYAKVNINIYQTDKPLLEKELRPTSDNVLYVK